MYLRYWIVCPAFRLAPNVKQLIKMIIAQTPYRIVRDRGANRFQAIESCLRNMSDLGYRPNVIIDGGAHLGLFSLDAKKAFPGAVFHLVEPQPACIAPLRALCAKEGFVLHECALADRVGEVRLSRTQAPSTGAHVVVDREAGTDVVPTSTLDTLFAHCVAAKDRALLKLDLQGYELHALRGGAALLRSVDVILTEVSFFAQAYEPRIAELVAFLDASGFQLYDVAALAGRTRDNRLRQGDFIFARAGSHLLADAGWE